MVFAAGETIEILEETNADWWKGQNARGETGLFPANHVEKVVVTKTPPAVPVLPALPGRRMVAPMPNEKASYDPMASAPPQPPVQQQEVPQKKNKFGKYGNTVCLHVICEDVISTERLIDRWLNLLQVALDLVPVR